MASSHATPFAGSWYPDRPAELAALLDQVFERSLERTGPSLFPRPLAFVVPHAGLAYSGAVAASVYRYLQAAPPERVILLGFRHSGGPSGVAIPDIAAFETPLGPVEIDRAAVQELAAGGRFAVVPEHNVCDHSVEIQLPLLRKAVPGVPVVPLYVNFFHDGQRAEAAQTLARFLRPSDMLLASSDLTHYGHAFHYQPFPPGEGFHRRLFHMDSQIIDAAGSVEAAMFHETLTELSSTVCGRDPIALLLDTLQLLAGEDVFQHTLDYQTSAEITGDTQHSVSYAALGYFRPDSFLLDHEAQAALTASARATLDHFRSTGKRKPIPPGSSHPDLQRRAALFVSLHYQGDLFGCIGTRSAKLPVAEAVPDLTLSAALDDPRFWQGRAIPEGLDIEISVLTPQRRIRNWRFFRVGRDGACLDFGRRTELLLPQVAEHGSYNATGFLEALSRKAGLPHHAYGDPRARLSVFRAQVIV